MAPAARKPAKGSAKGPPQPASCVHRPSSTMLVLHAEVSRHSSTCHPSASSPSLMLTGGCRVGHAAALSPEDRGVIVVAGGSVLAAGEGLEECDFTSMALAAAGEAEAGSAPCHAAGGASPGPGLTPSDDSLHDVGGRGAAVDVPAQWRTPFPFVECFDIERGVWFVPEGQTRRSAAVGGGAMRWPTQAAAVVLWEGEPRALPGALARSAGAKARSRACGTPGPAAATDCDSPRDDGGGEHADVAVVAAAAPPPPKPQPRRRKVSPSTFDRLTYTSPNRTPRKRGHKDDGGGPIADVPNGDGGATAANMDKNVPYTPVGFGMAPHGGSFENLRGASAAGSGTGTAPPESAQSPAASTVPAAVAVRPPAEVLLLGGWDGAERLATLLTYYTGDIPTGSSDTDVAAAYTLPEVSALAAFPAVCHHSCTSVKGVVYCFGGNTLAGCVNDLWALDSAQLRAAHLRELEAQLQRQQQDLRDRKASSVAARSFAMGASISPVSHRNEELQQAILLSRVQAAAAKATIPGCDTGAGSAHGRAAVATAAAAGGWQCDRVLWPPAAAPPTPPSEPDQSTTSATVSVTAPSDPAHPPPAECDPRLLPPAPPARSSHAAGCLGGRFLVIFGGRQLILPVDSNAVDSKGKRGGKSAAGKRPPPAAKPAAAAAKGKKAGKNAASAPPTASWEEDETALPQLLLLDDVAVFDTETRRWLQATVSGGEAPAARYGAATCALPAANGGPSAELLVHGGVGAGGEVLGDAWILTAAAPPSVTAAVDAAHAASGSPSGNAKRKTGGPAAKGGRSASRGGPAAATRILGNVQQLLAVETDPETGAPSLFLRWVRVDLASAGTDATQRLQRRRARHALVATQYRELFIIGGQHAEAPAHMAVAAATAEPNATTPSPPSPAALFSSTASMPVGGALYSFVIPPLQRLVESPVLSQPHKAGTARGK